MALPEFKDLIELLKKGSTLEAQEKIVELREADLQPREELLTLNRALREKLDTRAALAFDGGHYWLRRDGREDGPFCPTCQDHNEKLVRLQAREPGAWLCNCCDGFFPEASYSDPGSTILRSNYLDY